MSDDITFWMSDDITFCYYSKCKNKKCERHPSNIKVHYIPHSFAFFKDCEHWDMPETYFTTSKEEEDDESGSDCTT